MNNKNSFDTILDNYLNEYSKNRKPIEINIRRIVNELKTSERATHFIHNYPAKLLMHIPYLFLNNTIFSKPGDTVLDPFCG